MGPLAPKVTAVDKGIYNEPYWALPLPQIIASNTLTSVALSDIFAYFFRVRFNIVSQFHKVHGNKRGTNFDSGFFSGAQKFVFSVRCKNGSDRWQQQPEFML